MAPRYALARRLARNLLQEGKIGRPPVPVERLAAQCGATIRYEPFDGELSGMMYCQSGRSAIIGVNSEDTAVRQRFTIAHEIGHLFLHKGEDVYIDEKPSSKFLRPKEMVRLRDSVSGQATDPREIEANQFAAELLMPQDFIFKSVEDLDPEISVDEAIEKLSHLFQVSSIAMTYRLTNLKILSSADEVAG